MKYQNRSVLQYHTVCVAFTIAAGNALREGKIRLHESGGVG